MNQRHDPRLEREIVPLLDIYPRIAIVGGPKVGKSTLARFIKTRGDRRVFLAEEFEAIKDWSTASLAMVEATRGRGRFAIESVRTSHALRKGMVVDAAVYLHQARETRTKRQIGMAKAVHTVFLEWRRTNPGVDVYVLGA